MLDARESGPKNEDEKQIKVYILEAVGVEEFFELSLRTKSSETDQVQSMIQEASHWLEGMFTKLQDSKYTIFYRSLDIIAEANERLIGFINAAGSLTGGETEDVLDQSFRLQMIESVRRDFDVQFEKALKQSQTTYGPISLTINCSAFLDEITKEID